MKETKVQNNIEEGMGEYRGSTLKSAKGPGKGMDRQKAVTIRLNALEAQKKGKN